MARHPDREIKQERLMASLERCAEVRGDIVPYVMERYYRDFPEALALFEALQYGGRARLEAQMVDQTLYCFMTWFVSPGEISILLRGTICRHLDTLGISPAIFAGMLDAARETVVETIPPDNADERAVWAEMAEAFMEMMRSEVDFDEAPGAHFTYALAIR